MIQLVKSLLRGDARETEQRVMGAGRGTILRCAAIIALGCGLYGLTVGVWRAPLQAAYTGVKFPLLIFLTCAGNALLNSILAQLLGTRLSFRQTSLAILLSFATAALVLGALTPVTLFFVLNAPPLGSSDPSTLR